MMPRTGLFRTLLLTAPLLWAAGTAIAQTSPGADAIIRALEPTELTRSWSRGISVEEGEVRPEPPSINLYINFAFDSDVLDTDAALVLDSLGRALGDEQLEQFRFLIAGHTDAKGTDEYNMDLSRRRAQSVRSYLTENFGITDQRLDVVGYGESRLLNPALPEDRVNRRVQIVNLLTAANE